MESLVFDPLCELIGATLNEARERKVHKCTIEFENSPTKIYYTGQLIRFNVNLCFNEKVLNVFVKIIGVAYVRWRDYDDVSSGKETFFEERVPIENTGNVTLLYLKQITDFRFQINGGVLVHTSLLFNPSYRNICHHHWNVVAVALDIKSV